MSRIRALAKESLIYGVSSIASRFLSFLLVPFYTHVFAPADFGITQIIFAIIAFLNILYQFGFDSAYLRLAADEDEAGRQRLFASAVWSQAAASLGFSLLLVALAHPLATVFLIPPSAERLFYYAAGILVLDTLTVVPFAHLRLRHQAGRFAALRLGNVILTIAGNLILVLKLRLGLEGLFLANLAASAATAAAFAPMLVSRARFLPRLAEVKALAAFGLPIVPAGLYGIINEMAGRMFMRRIHQGDIDRLYPGQGYDVLKLSGIFSLSWKLGVFGLLLVQMYRMAWQPFFQQRYRDPDAPELFGRVLRYFLLFIGYCSVSLMAMLDKLVAIPVAGRRLIDPAYWPGLSIVPGVLLSYALQAWVVHFTLGLYLAKQPRHLVWINGAGALVTVVGNWFLIPVLGLWGATLSAIACYLVIAVMITRKSQSLFPIDIGWKRMMPLLVWLAAGWIFGIAVQQAPTAYGWGARLGPLLAFWLLPFVLGLLKPSEFRSLLPDRGRGARASAPAGKPPDAAAGTGAALPGEPPAEAPGGGTAPAGGQG
jgi:O-antigen/teichoic acid export membrane protein